MSYASSSNLMEFSGDDVSATAVAAPETPTDQAKALFTSIGKVRSQLQRSDENLLQIHAKQKAHLDDLKERGVDALFAERDSYSDFLDQIDEQLSDLDIPNDSQKINNLNSLKTSIEKRLAILPKREDRESPAMLAAILRMEIDKAEHAHEVLAHAVRVAKKSKMDLAGFYEQVEAEIVRVDGDYSYATKREEELASEKESAWAKTVRIGAPIVGYSLAFILKLPAALYAFDVGATSFLGILVEIFGALGTSPTYACLAGGLVTQSIEEVLTSPIDTAKTAFRYLTLGSRRGEDYQESKWSKFFAGIFNTVLIVFGCGPYFIPSTQTFQQAGKPYMGTLVGLRAVLDGMLACNSNARMGTTLTHKIWNSLKNIFNDDNELRRMAITMLRMFDKEVFELAHKYPKLLHQFFNVLSSTDDPSMQMGAMFELLAHKRVLDGEIDDAAKYELLMADILAMMQDDASNNRQYNWLYPVGYIAALVSQVSGSIVAKDTKHFPFDGIKSFLSWVSNGHVGKLLFGWSLAGNGFGLSCLSGAGAAEHAKDAMVRLEGTVAKRKNSRNRGFSGYFSEYRGKLDYAAFFAAIVNAASLIVATIGQIEVNPPDFMNKFLFEVCTVIFGAGLAILTVLAAGKQIANAYYKSQAKPLRVRANRGEKLSLEDSKFLALQDATEMKTGALQTRLRMEDSKAVPLMVPGQLKELLAKRHGQRQADVPSNMEEALMATASLNPRRRRRAMVGPVIDLTAGSETVEDVSVSSEQTRLDLNDLIGSSNSACGFLSCCKRAAEESDVTTSLLSAEDGDTTEQKTSFVMLRPVEDPAVQEGRARVQSEPVGRV